jgi:hypothetical protein
MVRDPRRKEGIVRPGIKLPPAQRRILSALLALAIFLILAGISEMILARDATCRAKISRLNLAPDPSEVCMPEWETRLLQAASRGVALAVGPDVSPVIAWLMMGLFYAGLGFIVGQSPPHWTVLIILGVGLSLTAIVAAISYLSRFIIWPWMTSFP